MNETLHDLEQKREAVETSFLKPYKRKSRHKKDMRDFDFSHIFFVDVQSAFNYAVIIILISINLTRAI